MLIATVCELDYVKNLNSEEVGRMRILACKYTDDESKKRHCNNMGLVFFFGAKVSRVEKCIASYVLTPEEVKMFMEEGEPPAVRTVTDLSYILIAESFNLTMLDITSYAQVYPKPSIDSDGYVKDYVRKAQFELAYDLATKKPQREIDEFKMTGFKLAIKHALQNPHEGENITPSVFPVAYYCKHFDYMTDKRY